VSETDSAVGEPYAVLLAGQARRNIRENLPLDVVLAAMETIDGWIAINSYSRTTAMPAGEPSPSDRGWSRLLSVNSGV
jgi:hypothetical protein